MDSLKEELQGIADGAEEVEISLLPHSKPTQIGKPGRPGKRRMAQMRGIATAARAVRKARNGAKKSKFSPAARARLSALAKERWAKARAAGKAKLG